MAGETSKRICVLPALQGLGGPASFQARLAAGLRGLGWEMTHDPEDPEIGAILVIGGPRRLFPAILKAKRRGVRTVQRLNGMNWIHRQHWSGVRYFIHAEMNNLSLAWMRRLADGVVYQSNFTRGWWERVYGRLNKSQTVIYNAVDLQQFTPEGSEKPPTGHYRLLLVEGHLSKGYESGLISGVRLGQLLRQELDRPLELAVAGDVPLSVREMFKEEDFIRWLGVVPRESVAGLDRSAHLLFSADINAACPNAVVEALACGLPVIGFDTGALPEMLADGAGVISPYGGNPWKLEPPSLVPLAAAAQKVLAGQEYFRQAARMRAESVFDLKKMAAAYLEILTKTL